MQIIIIKKNLGSGIIVEAEEVPDEKLLRVCLPDISQKKF